MSDTVLQTDQETEIIEALKMWHFMLTRVEEDLYNWKWGIVALHNAVQTTIVRAISGPANLGAFPPNIAKQWLEVWESGTGEYPEPWLESFPKLYKKMKEKFDYEPGSSVDDSLERLILIRNQFIHYAPSGWVIFVNVLPPMAKDCMEIIMFLAKEKIEWNKEEILPEIEELHTENSALLEQLKDRYDA